MTKGKIAVLIPAVYDKLDKEFVSGIYQTLKENNFDTLVFTSVSTENTDGYMCGENNIYNLPFLCDVDGIIMASNRFYDNSLKESILKQLEKCKLPCILVEEESEKIKGVFLDQKKSIYDITEHLITVHNYENIICLTGPCENKEAQKRAEGYICAMEKYGISKNSKVIYGDFWHNSAIRLAERIASGEVSRPDAIVCTNDIMAISLCNELPKYNIKVPDDIAITGYDGSIYTLTTKPAITTVCGGDLCLGKMSVKALFEIMGIENSIDCGKTHIRICGSCGCENDEEEKNALLEQTTKMLRKQLDRKNLMFSNYIAKMSDCESIPKFASVLDELRYTLSDCEEIGVCLCEDWRVEHPEYRKSGYSENINLIYSDNQPGQLTFPLRALLPQLNLPHEPQFWVFKSLHYSDKIIGYLASRYDKAEQFTVDEHYVGWCDAVANGLDIVIKKSNTEYIWQKLEEKNMTDYYTGLMSRDGFVKKLREDDVVVAFSFPQHFKNMPYFVPVASAILRSQSSSPMAFYFGETVFGVRLDREDFNELSKKICKSLCELGIYISPSELNMVNKKFTDIQNASEQLLQLYNTLTDKNNVKKSEAYSDIFSQLRKEMKYSPQIGWSVSEAAEKTGLSGSHFQRLYKKHFGVSFTEELITFRIDRAKYLLKNTSMTVSQIAEECGYTNSAHFMRQFKERENISAGQFRKTLR